MDILFHHVALIGLGQMGTSLGLAMKQTGLVGTVCGYDLHPDHSSTAFSMEAIDAIATTPQHAVEDADLIVLCTPVGSYGALMQQVAPHLKDGATLSDVGSIKLQAIRDITPHLPDHVTFVPAHPIAGSEKVGPQQGRANFFKDHLFLITPIDGTDEEKVKPIAQLWHALGARVDLLPPELHDQIYAFMSHLPQLICHAAMPVFDAHHIRHHEPETLFGRFIRIGRSDPEMWRDVFLENAQHTLLAAANVESVLAHMRDELKAGMSEQQDAKPLLDDATRLQLIIGVLPRMLASAMVLSVQLIENQINMKLLRFAAGGFTDVACPAMEDSAQRDMELVSAHPQLIAALLDDYLAHHTAICDAVTAHDSDALLNVLTLCQAAGKRLITPLH